jgi:hypothetical protein
MLLLMLDLEPPLPPHPLVRDGNFCLAALLRIGTVPFCLVLYFYVAEAYLMEFAYRC